MMDSSFVAPLLLSLKVAAWATCLATLLGVCTAYGLSRSRAAWVDVIDAVLTLPMVLPPTVIGYYLLVVFGRHGVVGQWLDALGIQLIFTWQGAVLAATVVAFPMVLKAARGAFESVDEAYLDAARVLGVRNSAVFLRVTLCLALPGIFAGMVLAFARAFGEFGATLMIAGSIPGQTQTLSIAIYEAVQAGNDGAAGLLVVVASLVCVLALWVARRLVAGRAAFAAGRGRLS